MTSAAADRDLLLLVGPTLARSPFRRRSTWGRAVVVLRHDERRVTSRGDHAGWLAANDLAAAARECISRRVPPGCVLVWAEVDEEATAFVGFVVFDLATALRDYRSS